MTKELTKTQANDLLERIDKYNAQIKAAEVERDELALRNENSTGAGTRR